MATGDEVEELRAELAEWRRRAEIAEAVAAERLARAESAERALRAAEAALTAPSGTFERLPAGADEADHDAAQAPAPRPLGRPATLRERWRRYTDTIN